MSVPFRYEEGGLEKVGRGCRVHEWEIRTVNPGIRVPFVLPPPRGRDCLQLRAWCQGDFIPVTFLFILHDTRQCAAMPESRSFSLSVQRLSPPLHAALSRWVLHSWSCPHPRPPPALQLQEASARILGPSPWHNAGQGFPLQ